MYICNGKMELKIVFELRTPEAKRHLQHMIETGGFSEDDFAQPPDITDTEATLYPYRPESLPGIAEQLEGLFIQCCGDFVPDHGLDE